MTYIRHYEKRIIPIGARLAIIFGRFSIPFGLVFLAFSLFFAFAFNPLVSFQQLGNEPSTAIATIRTVDPTNTYVNDNQVKGYNYSFALPDGSQYYGKSYSEYYFYQPGDSVTVLYSRTDPFISKIEGMRSGEVGLWVLFLFLPFFLVGLGFTLFGLRKSFREIYLLQIGDLALGHIVKKEGTSSYINNQQVFKYTFEFKAKDGQKYSTICKTYKTALLEDEKQEKLVYDPNNPEKALLLDSLPRLFRKYIDSNR
jgi:hypothetical protein